MPGVLDHAGCWVEGSKGVEPLGLFGYSNEGFGRYQLVSELGWLVGNSRAGPPSLLVGFAGCRTSQIGRPKSSIVWPPHVAFVLVEIT